MASVCASTSTVKGVSLSSKAQRAPGAKQVARGVVCRASFENPVKRAAAAAVVAFPALTAYPVLAADIADRLGGEGTGAPFGLNESGPGWAIALTFGLVWALYAVSAKDLGGGESDESGLSL